MCVGVVALRNENVRNDLLQSDELRVQEEGMHYFWMAQELGCVCAFQQLNISKLYGMVTL